MGMKSKSDPSEGLVCTCVQAPGRYTFRCRPTGLTGLSVEKNCQVLEKKNTSTCCVDAALGSGHDAIINSIHSWQCTNGFVRDSSVGSSMRPVLSERRALPIPFRRGEGFQDFSQMPTLMPASYNTRTIIAIGMSATWSNK